MRTSLGPVQPDRRSQEGRSTRKLLKGENADMAVKFIPDGYHTATPYLIVKDAAAALDFYKKAFGATEVMRLADPSGKVGHAEIKIGDSTIMLADEFPEMGIRGPQSPGSAGVSI